MNEKENSKKIYRQEDNSEEDHRNEFNSELLINIPPDEENGVNEITYGINGMKLNQYQSSTKSNIDNPNQFISQSLLQKLEANTPMTIHEEVINLQQDYLKISLKGNSESGTPQMVATTPIGVDTMQEKDNMSKVVQGQGNQSPNAKKSESYFDKSKNQQLKNNVNRQPNNTSPIYTYFNPNQKILSEFLLQNEDSRERSNFVKKQPYDKTLVGGNFDQKSEGNNNVNNPLMNMNFNFFNKNVDNLLNSPAKNNPPLMHHQESERDNNNNNKDQKYIDLKSNYNSIQQQYYYQDSDEESSPQYPTFNMNKQITDNALINYSNSNAIFSDNNNKPFPFPDDFHQDLMMQPQKINSEDYIFEKFEKRGWECEKCNNFNFETRVKCNRCGVPMQPKLLWKIRKEGLEKREDKKKKPLKERQGDWSCPKCRNLNFSFRQICNRCQLPKTEAELMALGMPPLYPPDMSNYSNLPNPGFNYVDSQNMINGNINIHNYFNMNNKGMLYQNMNMVKYMNDPMGNIPFPQFQLEQQQQKHQQPQHFQSKKGKSSQIGKTNFESIKETPK